MRSEPIPNELLGDEIIVQTPAEGGWVDSSALNVRVERTEAIDSGYPDNPKNKTRLKVWFDFVNSQAQSEFNCGMRIKYGGETFNIVNVKLYKTDAPHHLKITAEKIEDGD